MSTESDIREFLASRRAKITPRQAGLPAYGGNRRVPGLRREEVALLAGVSIDYYIRLERGHIAGASEEVLDAVANALRLDDAERAHLYDLARAAAKRPARRTRRARGPIPDSVLRVLDSMGGSPAFIRNGRLDLLAANHLGRALYSPLFTEGTPRPVNIARFQFLDPRGRDFFPDWDESRNTTVSLLRTEAGRAPHDTELTGLIGELVTRSEEFRTAWAKHNVRLHHTGRKSFRHPAVGVLSLDFDAMELPAQPGLTLTAYSAAPGTPDHDALQLLASWAATENIPHATEDIPHLGSPGSAGLGAH
ncbi:helix-turn-helix transcriptional regulator [Streptomyces griseoviridis]|uniref:Transcriptional regulator n=1 Tax=Streptomyces griseoviridis TaxID=45398 RepID=A0A3S9Z8R9_STRGD|nr:MULTISPECIES: helix-turn-helix transcriptional regulator [Streptomyces]AZS84176.1 XRE family transcriptional regulator [Streptomyces griseoviridis]MDH6697099.1 transcriptional regulator with XRE-family HTH domain [Streptomyces sp. MAA16]QCN88967.1 transcriptional regulator [Streptomyces griseoviridis]